MTDDSLGSKIYFYGKTDEYGFLSNTADHGFYMDDKYWRTVEHYYQAQKFAGTEHEERIRKSRTVREAGALGRNRKVPMREDWEEAKAAVMRKAVAAKFTGGGGLSQRLLDTGDAELIEASPYDHFWGCGASGTGLNMLGTILMETRAALQREASTGC